MAYISNRPGNIEPYRDPPGKFESSHGKVFTWYRWIRIFNFPSKLLPVIPRKCSKMLPQNNFWKIIFINYFREKLSGNLERKRHFQEIRCIISDEGDGRACFLTWESALRSRSNAVPLTTRIVCVISRISFPNFPYKVYFVFLGLLNPNFNFS